MDELLARICQFIPYHELKDYQIKEISDLQFKLNKSLEKTKNIIKFFDHSSYHCMCDYCLDEELQKILDDVKN